MGHGVSQQCCFNYEIFIRYDVVQWMSSLDMLLDVKILYDLSGTLSNVSEPVRLYIMEVGDAQHVMDGPK